MTEFSIFCGVAMRLRIPRFWPLWLLAAFVFAVGGVFWYANPIQVYALGASDVEIEFLVTDGRTGAAIPGAAIKVKVQDSREMENKVGTSVLCANAVGLVNSPIGQGPILASSVCFPDRPEPDFTLLTDKNGKANFFKSHNMWEDIVRLRSTKRVFFMSWGSLSVSAKGYEVVKDLWLPEVGYSDQGHDDQNHRHQLRVHLSLHRD
jgi:hypothetical protein